MIIDPEATDPICAGCGTVPCESTRGNPCPSPAGIATASPTGLLAIERALTRRINAMGATLETVRFRIRQGSL